MLNIVLMKSQSLSLRSTQHFFEIAVVLVAAPLALIWAPEGPITAPILRDKSCQVIVNALLSVKCVVTEAVCTGPDRPFFAHDRGRHQGAKRPFNFMANQVPDVKNKIRGLSPQISENMKRTPEFFPPIF